jgi:hypothetical protein
MGDTCSTHSAYEKSVHNLANEKLKDPNIKRTPIYYGGKGGLIINKD